MHQTDFNYAPRTRNTDPETSRLAEDKVLPYLPGLHRKVWDALKVNPGLTAMELAQAMWKAHPIVGQDWRYYHEWTRRRLPELVTRRKATRGQKRTCTVSKNLAITWFAT
jgi:hypothetical protein